MITCLLLMMYLLMVICLLNDVIQDELISVTGVSTFNDRVIAITDVSINDNLFVADDVSTNNKLYVN